VSVGLQSRHLIYLLTYTHVFLIAYVQTFLASPCLSKLSCFQRTIFSLLSRRNAYRKQCSSSEIRWMDKGERKRRWGSVAPVLELPLRTVLGTSDSATGGRHLRPGPSRATYPNYCGLSLRTYHNMRGSYVGASPNPIIKSRFFSNSELSYSESPSPVFCRSPAMSEHERT
jgi:hypothetical protein